jgi:hypothetical protein
VKSLLLVVVSILMTTSAFADVQLQMKDSLSGLSTISSDGKKARIESGKMPGFVIIDFSAGKLYRVNPERQEVVNMDIAKDGGAAASSVQVSFKGKGGGPKIAGYLTQKHDYQADGTSCGSVFTSSKLLKNNTVGSMFDSMRQLQQQSRKMLGGMMGFPGPCQQAQLDLANALGSKGVPMRMLDAGGNLISEVVSVNIDKAVPAGYYQVPGGMKQVSVDEKMNQAQQQMQDAMQNMPNVDQMMEQMGANNGQMTEEMQQQMKKMQDMLKQLQQ